MSNVYDAVWQRDREEPAENSAAHGMFDIHTFIYEDDSVIIHLLAESPAADLPQDNVYRLKTKWKSGELYLFLPLGNKWEPFAVWEDERFVMYAEGKKKIFKKIRPEEIATWQRDVLKPGRELWRYRYLNPDDIAI